MMGTYAAKTEVSSDRSRAEIERTLIRYGATGFGYLWEGERAAIQFTAHGRRVRFMLPLPSRDDPKIRLTPTRKVRSKAVIEQAYEQAVKQRWRALALVIKAKLEAVESGIVVFDEEFMAHLVLPGGETVAERIGAQIDEAYRTGELPPLMPGPLKARLLPSGE